MLCSRVCQALRVADWDHVGRPLCLESSLFPFGGDGQGSGASFSSVKMLYISQGLSLILFSRQVQQCSR